MSALANLAADWALDLFIPGRPAPQGSKRHVGGGRLIESSKHVAPWRTTVAWAAAQAYDAAPIDGPVLLRMDFVMPRPTSTPKRRTPAAIKYPDLDKLIRAAGDALSGIVWRNDSMVVDMRATKRLAELDEKPGMRVRVRAAAGAA